MFINLSKISIWVIAFAIAILFLIPFTALAQRVSPSPSLSPSSVLVVNSYEIFWPLTAGKTIDDPLYFLKTFKENVRGWLIFGSAQKADYAVFLGTKRVLEAAKLIAEDKKELANQTFDKALEQFEIAQKNVEEASSKDALLANSVATMKPRLTNLINFLPTLKSDKANEVLQKVSDLNNKL